MILYLFIVTFLLTLWWLADIVGHRMVAKHRATQKLRRECEHPQWRYANAFNDRRFPVRTCFLCGLQQHLEAPVPCRHCGGNINEWPIVKLGG